MSRKSPTLIESLESRTLLSAVLTAAVPVPSATTFATVTSVAPPTTSVGLTFHLTAGVSFTGVVAFYPSPVLDPPDHYSAKIHWGDGSVSQATLQYGVQGNVGGYEIIGTHTYAHPGDFRIATTVFVGPINPKLTTPIKIVAQLVSLAIVSPASTGGVTIHEVAGVPFTADIGSFNFPVPGTGLVATVSWGDGNTSRAVIQPSGVVGLDVIHFDVIGAHTYVVAGTYAIHIIITKPSPTPSSTPVNILLTIDSTAIVAPPIVPVSTA